MKKRFLLLGLIFALMTFTSHAQIYEMFSENFETSSSTNYTVSNPNSVGVQTSIVSGGSRALKMTHTQSSEVSIVLDTIDFSTQADWAYFTLEFMHQAFVDATKCPVRGEVCMVEVKRPGQSAWTRLNESHYNMADGGSSEFNGLASFSKFSYADWEASTAANNSLWKKERFDLDQIFQGVATTDKKLIIRFVLSERTVATGSEAWYIDDIKVCASSQAIITPTILMRVFPDYIKYPSSRGAKISADVTTTALQGINGDSVYVVYRVGNSNVLHRAYMHRQGNTSHFVGRIPFYGYDTLITYHVVAKDSTRNNNTVYFPKNSSQWLTFKCVRGKTATGQPTGTQSNNQGFPFPEFADNRSEFIYDSATMAQMGFGPGYITNFRFIVATSPRTVTRPHFRIYMTNVSNTTQRSSTNEAFTATTMQLVYDSAFVIEQAAPNSYKVVNLQDTFFYAGSDMIIQFLYDGDNNVQAHSIKHIPAPANKNSLFIGGHDDYLDYHAFTDKDNFNNGIVATTRPWIQFYETQNVPLIYDCGVSGFSYPSYETPCNIGTDSVVVWLKNFGVSPMNAVRIWYRIDNQTAVYHDWVGTLNGGDSVRVHLNDNQNFTVGYHTIRAWVDDTITIDTLRMRDHEPYNDTSYSPFAACDGPYSGVRTVGTGSGAHFASLEKCLYALSRCGIDAPLTIKLPAGVYDITKFPYIPGTSETNYVQFEPATATAQVTFRRSRNGVTTNAPTLVDLSEARGIRFKNIRFANGRFTDNRCDVLAQLGENSAHCQFLNCTFVDSNSVTTSAAALIHTGSADSVLIQNCSFYGGVIGTNINGTAPDMRSRHNIVQFNNYVSQINTAISVTNQDDVWIDSNYVNDVQTNASYIVLGQYLYDGSRITRNRVFSTKGASCIGVSDIHGTASDYCVIANNMLVSLDDGTTNMLTTPLNIIKGDYVKVVFNSVRMNAPERVNVAAATLGGDIVSNIYFQNNVIATFDTSNYAFSFIPGDNASTLHVDHNCYYSVSGVLNKLTGVNYNNLNAWTRVVPSDQGSVSGNPNYTNGSVCRVDLRSFNALLRNVGTPIPEVTIDLYGTTRNATAPSLGAYEVTALAVDFTPVEFVTPLEDYCGAPASIPVEVVIRNTGNGTYTYTPSTPIHVSYSIDNGPIQSFNVTRNCGPNDTIHFLSNRTMSLPYGANNSDRTYSIRWSASCSIDPDDLNDTAVYTVISRYAAPAPNTINMTVPYNTSAVVTPVTGVNTWPVSYYTSGNGRQQRSGISWYHSMDDTARFFYGPTLTTTPLFDDTTFYISQKRNLPLVKITEVQVNRTYPGVTNPLPSWMNTQTAFAVELTNCGDYPANLEGDSLIVVQPTADAKVWVLPNVTIQPGENLVLQYKALGASDSSRTLYCPSSAVVAPAYTANFGVIYHDGHGVADAVAFNGVISTASTRAISWGNEHIPAAIWQGNAIDLAKNGNTSNTTTAGARRISWPTNSASASPTATASLWQVATAEHLMHIGETEENLIRYFDNGCEGAMAAVNIQVSNVPNIDLAVDEPVVDTGCNLTNAEPVSVLVHNYGSSPVSSVVVKYSLNGGATVHCSDTISTGIGVRSSVFHTFSVPINMHTPHDSTFHVKVWVDAHNNDAFHHNDTSEGYYFAAYTPEIPVVNAIDSVDYGDRLTIYPGGVSANSRLAWFDARHNALDTTAGAYTTPNIYHFDTFFVKAIAMKDVPNTHVGTLATAINNFPSPYSPKMRYAKEQYIVTADQLLAAGHSAGTISSLSFFLESLAANTPDYTFTDFKIKMGTTTASTFANASFLTTSLSEVFSSNQVTISNDHLGWIQHVFDTPFQWDGTSNILIEVYRSLPAAYTSGVTTRYTACANTVITKSANTDVLTQASGTKGGNRPDMLFGFLEPVGCESPEAMVRVHVSNVPPYDGTISWVAATDTTVEEFNSCDTSNVNVVLTNMGSQSIDGYTLRYKIDNNAWQQTTGSANNLPLGYTRTLPLLSHHFTPGRHTIIAVVNIPGDTVTSNDTIFRTINVRFCAGNYTVGSCSGSDYPSMAIALDTLHNAGVAGPVVFELCQQTFNEHLDFADVPGSSDTNTVTFTTISGASDMAQIRFTPLTGAANADANYVAKLSGASNIIFDSIYFYSNYTTGSGNNIFANVLRIDNSTNVTLRNCTLRSRATTASTTNANLLLLGDNNHYITVDNCVLDSGYYAVRSLNNNYSDNITISNSDILHFWYQGVCLRNTDSISVYHDSITASAPVNAKPLTGIYVATSNHASIQRNFIHLNDTRTGGKRGIVLNGCRGTNIDRVTVYNNMISLNGTDVNALATAGIWIDSLCKYVNVYFNTSNVCTGVNKPDTRAFSCQRSSQVYALNNIFKNESRGYAYYVAVDTCMGGSNFNVYYSNCPANENTGARKFAHWGTSECTSLDSLRVVNGKDPNSYEEYPFFVDSVWNLRCGLAQFAGYAQYNPDVTTDIYGAIRPQIPPPTIGAHEFNRCNHDVVVANIVEPCITMTGNAMDVRNIETDSILVLAQFYNNGNSPENNVTWYAYLNGVTPEVRSVTRTMNIPLHRLVVDTVRLASPLGIVDTQQVIVHVDIAPNLTDNVPDNNSDTTEFFIFPAYDLQLQSVVVDSTCDPAHCRMFSVPLKYTLKNAGKKDYPGDFVFTLGYDYFCQSHSSQSFPNFPGSSSLDVQTLGNALPVGTSCEVHLSQPYEPNLYPTGTLLDITARLRGFVSAQYDIKQMNDTTSYFNITSNHTPNMPIAHDTMVDYGSYGNLWATQDESRVIRWSRDTASGNFFYNGNNNYNRSTHWSATPQYFHDSLYYLSCVSSKTCTSYYSNITVGINPPLTTDVSISEVRSPRGSGRVYLELDTVTLRVVNYGAQPVSNIPVAFKFMNANGRTTYLEVHDTVRATIPGRVGDNVSYYDHTFGSCAFDTALLQINQPLSNTTFTLNAWVYHPDDQQRGNDTLRTVHTFRSLAENVYDTINQYAPTSTAGFDITRVSFNELDNVMPDMIGYDNLVLGSYHANSAEVPCLYVLRGTQDTLTIEVANNQNEMDSSTAASLCVVIDYNRDGQYDFDGFENVTKTNLSKGVKVRSRREFKQALTIPEKAHYGYMRMLVWVDGDSAAYIQGLPTSTHASGQMQQYLLYVQEDCMLDSVDAALTRVVSPRNHIVTENDHFVTVMLANKGSQPLTQAAINYSFSDALHIAQTGTVNWSGNLEPGKSEIVRLDSINFYEGTTDLVCSVEVPGDTIHTANNTLQYQYHRYYVVELRFIDSFDQVIDKWYAPAGYNAYTHNYFSRGIPAKSNISYAYSSPNAYITDCMANIVTGKHGNRSVLYTPIINIRQIQPDTIRFLISKDMAAGASLRMEYKNYLGDWAVVDHPGARYGVEDNEGWYDEPDGTGWTGSTRNGEYIPLMLPTSLIRGEFGQEIQFRFVFTTPVETSSSAAFGDGVAIDNFSIGRAQRSVDVGVTEITYPENPQFGQTIYPRVIIHNYGYDQLSNFVVCYRPYGTYLPHEAICTDTIPAGGDLEFEFPDPFIVTNVFPDTFDICAFTKVSADLYDDNDTVVRTFGLSPLANDLYMYSIMSPLESATAGDSLYVTVRLRNFGQNEIEDCDVTYVYNDGTPVVEHIHFADYLGHPLGSTEFFNYSFLKRVRANVGTMTLQTWCSYDLDVYPYNDTLYKEIAGIAALTDLQATAYILDLRDFEHPVAGIVIDNVGARMANNIPVGFWFDNDPDSCGFDTIYMPHGLAAGARAVHYFNNRPMFHRDAPFIYFTAYVSHPDDTNHSNDTTTSRVNQFVDLSIDKTQIEENRNDECRYRVVVTNRGTYPFFNYIDWTSVINDVSQRTSIAPNTYYLEPGQTKHFLAVDANGNPRMVPKSPTRQYTGMSYAHKGFFNDSIVDNNSSTIIEVLNYFEDIDAVESSEFGLDQNYPNPCEDATRIEFVLPYPGRVNFFVTDVLGRRVYESSQVYSEGRNAINLDTHDLNSGIYYYSVEFDGQSRMRKMIVK